MAGQTAEDLFNAGQDAYDAGDFGRAHVLWQQAAHLAPKDARVWRALLRVVETDDDRRTCLKNLLRIDPRNAVVTRQLEALDWFAPPNEPVAEPHSTLNLVTRATGRLVLSGVLIGVLFLLGLVIGVLINNLF